MCRTEYSLVRSRYRGCVTATDQSSVKVGAAGATGGLMSGLFGVGGGVVMVPIFVFWLGLDQKRAITTSLVAIVPIAVFGAAGYAWGGAVAWGVGLAVGAASIIGGQIGVRLLPRIPVFTLQVAFAALLLYSAYRLVMPSDWTAPVAGQEPWLLLAGVGVVAGLVAALLGVGGGIIVVPALVLLAGTDLTTARGTSLVVVVLTALTASFTNIRAGRADTRVGILAGLVGAPAAVLGSFLGQWLPERVAAALFALLMVVAAAQLLRRAWTGRRIDRSAPDDQLAGE